MYSDAVLILPSKKSFKVISHSCRKAALYQKNLIFVYSGMYEGDFDEFNFFHGMFLQYYYTIIANFVTIL